jgi:hypothetical protein
VSATQLVGAAEIKSPTGTVVSATQLVGAAEIKSPTGTVVSATQLVGAAEIKSPTGTAAEIKISLNVPSNESSASKAIPYEQSIRNVCETTGCPQEIAEQAYSLAERNEKDAITLILSGAFG